MADDRRDRAGAGRGRLVVFRARAPGRRRRRDARHRGRDRLCHRRRRTGALGQGGERDPRPHRRRLRLRGQNRRQGRRAGAARRWPSAGGAQGAEGARRLPQARDVAGERFDHARRSDDAGARTRRHGFADGAGADLRANRENIRLHHRRADGRRGAAPRRRDRRDRRSRADPVSRRRAQAAAGGGRGERGRHPARQDRANRAVPHRRVSRPAAGRQSERDHAHGRRRRQDLSRQDGAARRHAAQAGHERGSQYRHARKAGRAADPGRRAARQRGVRARRRHGAQARGQGRHPRHPPGRGALRPCRRRAGRFAGGDRSRGRRARAHHRIAGRESHLRYRLHPCARPRAADRFCRRRGRHRGRLLDHDGLADAGLAGRLHPPADQHAAAHHRQRRAPHAAAAAGGGRVQGRRNPRSDAGSAPARYQESARHHGRAGGLDARRGGAVGEGAGDHPLRQPRRLHHRDRHRSAAREQGVRTAQADARRQPQSRSTAPPTPSSSATGWRTRSAPASAPISRCKPARARASPRRWSACSTPACASRTRARLTC